MYTIILCGINMDNYGYTIKHSQLLNCKDKVIHYNARRAFQLNNSSFSGKYCLVVAILYFEKCNGEFGNKVILG